MVKNKEFVGKIWRENIQIAAKKWKFDRIKRVFWFESWEIVLKIILNSRNLKQEIIATNEDVTKNNKEFEGKIKELQEQNNEFKGTIIEITNKKWWFNWKNKGLIGKVKDL